MSTCCAPRRRAAAGGGCRTTRLRTTPRLGGGHSVRGGTCSSGFASPAPSSSPPPDAPALLPAMTVTAASQWVARLPHVDGPSGPGTALLIVPSTMRSPSATRLCLQLSAAATHGCTKKMPVCTYTGSATAHSYPLPSIGPAVGSASAATTP
eukprot:CAMPEP_0174836322 /NCGR_PEP_ID=MMETSP1114-20130205/5989_1 /TAXON_ID=312471 /ORGANISM="Neobodo designis, Strain CCAP 1951/1" /LENGTH=151 /DNA_ID=CAMNT_0016070307 /DNA_START=147 /DNA_END=598 /DNA_ORIENTATION=-